MTQSVSELFSQVLKVTTDEVYVQCPCKVVAVNGNFVDVMAYINDDEPDFVLYNVPIKRQETQSAYFYLKIAEGDYGTLRFYDRSIEEYIKGDTEYSGDDRQHDINDRCFELGFIPEPSAYSYTTNALIEIGCKDGVTNIQINEGAITINGNVTVNGTLTADSVIAKDGASGTFANSVTSTNGIIVSGS